MVKQYFATYSVLFEKKTTQALAVCYTKKRSETKQLDE